MSLLDRSVQGGPLLPVVVVGGENGPGTPLDVGDLDIAEKTIQYATGTKAVSGDNTIIASPGAGFRTVITHLVIQNESATATTMILKEGLTQQLRCLGQNQGDGLAMVFPAGREWKLATNKALILNLSGANSCGYSIGYYTEAA